MKGFIVQLNGEPICTAGVERGTVTALVTHSVRSKRSVVLLNIDGIDDASDDPVEWQVPQIGVGDVITIKVVENESVTPEPASTPPAKTQ